MMQINWAPYKWSMEWKLKNTSTLIWLGNCTLQGSTMLKWFTEKVKKSWNFVNGQVLLISWGRKCDQVSIPTPPIVIRTYKLIFIFLAIDF